MAAAIGAGLPVTEPSGNMIVDIGGGTTEVAVISLAGIVVAKSIRVAGDKMDEAIVEYIKRKYNLLIGERTAETHQEADRQRLPDRRGADHGDQGARPGGRRAQDAGHEQRRDPRGAGRAGQRDRRGGPSVLERTPPELAADIVDRGIVLAGGGALLKNLDVLLREETGLPVMVSDSPECAVVLGTGRALDELGLLREVALQ